MSGWTVVAVSAIIITLYVWAAIKSYPRIFSHAYEVTAADRDDRLPGLYDHKDHVRSVEGYHAPRLQAALWPIFLPLAFRGPRATSLEIEDYRLSYSRRYHEHRSRWLDGEIARLDREQGRRK